jgi:hypothetical protein
VAGQPDRVALADALEAEHAVIEPLLTVIDAAAARSSRRRTLKCSSEAAACPGQAAVFSSGISPSARTAYVMRAHAARVG